jgi:hypothetical protein
MIGASALAFILTPGVASASQECGVPDASVDPNVVSCVSDPTQYADGITYDQGSYATPAGIKIDLYGTVVVAPVSVHDAVTVYGSVDHGAQISARAGSRINAAGTALLAQTTGTGTALVESHGATSVGTAGLMAISDAGLASVINESDGSVSLNMAPSPGTIGYGIAAFGGSASAVNDGTITVSDDLGNTVYGISGASSATDGTLSLSNTSAISVTASAGDIYGIGTTSSSGQVDLVNSGTISVSNTGGNAVGLSVAGSGSGGATTLTNTGLLSVSAGAGGSAIGMGADEGTSVALVSQRTSAADGFSVSGDGAAIGFAVDKASGPVSVSNDGVAIGVTGSSAYGVEVLSGSTESVHFGDATVDDAVYSGDLTVNGTGAATGVGLFGATDEVNVDFEGANLSVTSMGDSATGISTSGGTTVTITTAPDTTTENGAALTVQAAGPFAHGIEVQGASGAETVTIGDGFTVSNSDGAAAGLLIDDGTTQTVSLAQGLSTTGSVSAVGAALTDASGAINLHSAGAFTVQGGSGGATGVAAFNGTDQTLVFDADFNVSSSDGGFATGVSTGLGTGAIMLDSRGAFTVDAGRGMATGISMDMGTDQTVSLAQGATITGQGATGASMTNGTGQTHFISADIFSVDGGTGDATGVKLSGGTSETVDFTKAVKVQASGDSATGVISTGTSDNLQVTAGDGFTVTNDTGSAVGIQADSGADETISLAGLSVHGAMSGLGASLNGTGTLDLTSAQDFGVTSDESAIGMSMQGGTQNAVFQDAVHVTGTNRATGVIQGTTTGTVNLMVSGEFDITGGAAGSVGLLQLGGTVQTARFDGDVSVAAAGDTVTGIVQFGNGQNASLVTNASLSVTNSDGSSVGILIAGANATTTIGRGLTVSGATDDATGVVGINSSVSGTSAIAVNGAIDVTNDPDAIGGTATGVSASAGTAQTVSIAGPVTVSAQGEADGVALSGDGTLELTTADTVSVGSGGGSATGVSLTGGTDQSASLAKAVTVTANGPAAYGVAAYDATGTVQVGLGDTLSVTNAGGAAEAVQLVGGSAQTLTLGGAVSAQATGDDAYGIDLRGATGVATAHLPATVTAASDTGSAIGIYAENGGGLLIDGDSSVSATGGGDSFGIYSTGETGTQDLTLGDVTATSTGGMAAGVALDGADAVRLADSGTITANGATAGGAGVMMRTAGADAAISATLDTVVASGNGTAGVVITQAGGAGSSGTIDATIDAVSTSGADATGVAVTGSESGATIVTLGQDGGVTTTGNNAAGVDLAVTDGDGTIVNNGTISTTGSAASGIVANASGAGGVTIQSWNIATTGAGADGIAVITGAGAQSIDVSAVTVSGAGSEGISAISDSGAITVTGGNISAAGGEAIRLASNSGNVRVTLADGSATSSGAGAGLNVQTGGTATIDLGDTDTSATLHGVTAGLISNATGGQAITLSGTVGADSNLAVALTGGATTLVNKGVINGYMTLNTSSLAFTNAGTWNAFGGTSTFAAGATFTNSGTFNVYPTATAPTTLALTGLGSFDNSGTVSLVNGHVGDVLDLGGVPFVGSGNSLVVLEANLGGAAVDGNAPQTADRLVTGAASGTTTIAIKDLSGEQAAQFNFTGIRVVEAASAAEGTFVLDGGSIDKGFAEYQLLADGDGNLDLVSVPTTAAFELVRTGAEVRRYWRRSADAWLEQMRNLQQREGFSTWGQFYGGGETSKSRPTYTETVLGNTMTFRPDLDVHDGWAGGQAGFNWGKGDWDIGVSGGYASQNGRVKSTADRIKINGGNIGLYARYRSPEGLFAHALAKVDRYTVKYDLGGAASAPKFDGTSYGLDVEAGYHVRTGSAFLEPAVGLSWSHADLDGVRGAAGGFDASFNHVDSTYGRAGLRAGLELRSGTWAVKPYVGANWEGELSGRPGMILTSGGTGLNFLDTSEGGHGRFEAGVQGTSDHGLSLFAMVEDVAGGKMKGVGGRAGIALRW